MRIVSATHMARPPAPRRALPSFDLRAPRIRHEDYPQSARVGAAVYLAVGRDGSPLIPRERRLLPRLSCVKAQSLYKENAVVVAVPSL